MSISLFLLLVAGGALGALTRAALGERLNARLALGTLLANVVSSLFLGAASGWLGSGHWQGPEVWNAPTAIAVQVGLLGALSTWSSLANDLAVHLRAKQHSDAATALALNLILGIGAAWLGIRLAHSLG